MRTRIGLVLVSLAIGLAMPARAQDVGSSDSTSFAVTGNVPALCAGGTLDGGGSFDFGILIDLTTGLLREDLAADAQTMTGAFCSARSTITVDASPMLAQNYLAAPPAGFSRSIDFVATASGWTETAASFDTAAAANPGSVQQRDSAFTGDIVVTVNGLAVTGGASLRPVADSQYLGQVVVTLAAES